MTEKPMLIQSRESLDHLLREQKISILYFSSSNCNVCHALLPKVLKLAQNYEIVVGEINIQELREEAGQFLVFTVPTLLIMLEGKEILRESRFIDLLNVARTLESLSEYLEPLLPSGNISLSNI
ncbi:thioredoxin family protein [Desulfitobacterium dehalogenans]|nr:thioredoxin family protein [Desulfitobacterium dehalogenans]